MTIADRLLFNGQDALCDALYRLTGRDEPDMGGEELAAEVLAVIRSEPERLRECLGEQSVTLYLERVRTDKPEILEEEADRSATLASGVDDFLLFGLCDETERGWALDPGAARWLEAGEEEKSKLEQQDMVYMFVDGLLLHVGMMEFGLLLEQVSRTLPFADRGMLIRVLTARYGLQTWYPPLAGAEEPGDGTWICLPELEDAETLLDSLRSPEIAPLPYADLGVERLLVAHALGMAAGRKELQGLILYLRMNGYSFHDAMELAAEAVFVTGNAGTAVSGTQAALQTAEGFDPRPGEEVIGVLSEFCAALPRWSLKGHTLQEAEELLRARRAARLGSAARGWDAPRFIPFPSGDRAAEPVSPEAPCPCGSGKPYAQCHGRRM